MYILECRGSTRAHCIGVVALQALVFPCGYRWCIHFSLMIAAFLHVQNHVLGPFRQDELERIGSELLVEENFVSLCTVYFGAVVVVDLLSQQKKRRLITQSFKKKPKLLLNLINCSWKVLIRRNLLIKTRNKIHILIVY